MQTGDHVGKDCIMISRSNSGFGKPLVFECGTVLPSYGLSNGGVANWEELPWRGGAIANVKNDGSFNPVITASGAVPCPRSGDWEILGTEIKEALVQGDVFPSQYKNYIWALQECPIKKDESEDNDGISK